MNKPCLLTYVAMIVIIAFVLFLIFGFRITISQNYDGKNITASGRSGLRPSCLKCVRKHIGQAIVLLKEAQTGYPEHFWIAMGHLAEAEDESIREYSDLANKIRDAREMIIAGQDVNLMPFYGMIDKM